MSNFPPQPPPPQPGGGGSRTGLILGGIAVALFLGFLALVVVGALIYFFAIRTPAAQPGGGTPPTQVGGGTTPTQPGGGTTPVQPGGGTPKAPGNTGGGGSLRDNVPQQVGDFRLQGVEPFQEAIAGGATDGVKASYTGPSGAQVTLLLAAFASPDRANADAQASGQTLTQNGFQALQEFRPGQVGVYTKGQDAVILDTEQNLEIGITGPGTAVQSFTEALAQSGDNGRT